MPIVSRREILRYVLMPFGFPMENIPTGILRILMFTEFE